MGIYLHFDDDKLQYPNNLHIACNYSYWNKFRLSIVSSFIKFLSFFIEANQNNFIEGKNFRYIFCQNLIKLLNEYKETYDEETTDIDGVVELFLKYNNELSCFNFNGILKLINKEDGAAYYSSGDSYDILCMLNTINDYINDYHTETIYNLKPMLEYSIKNKQPICIS